MYLSVGGIDLTSFFEFCFEIAGLCRQGGIILFYFSLLLFMKTNAMIKRLILTNILRMASYFLNYYLPRPLLSANAILSKELINNAI